jgi:hypothetical protein
MRITLRPFVYLSSKQKKESLFLMTHLVDNSIEISNISLLIEINLVEIE